MIEKTLKKDNTIYYIYKENGQYRMTTKQNFNAYIMDLNKVTKFDGFTSANQIIDYMQKYAAYFGEFEIL